MTKGFTISVPQPIEADPIEFFVEGTEEALYAYPPSGGQLAVMMAGISGDDDAEGVSGMINGIFAMFDDETRAILRKRLLAPDHVDPFGMNEIMQILSALMEESTDRPTESSSASAPSRTTTATPSRGGARRQVPATRTPSRRTGS